MSVKCCGRHDAQTLDARLTNHVVAPSVNPALHTKSEVKRRDDPFTHKANWIRAICVLTFYTQNERLSDAKWKNSMHHIMVQFVNLRRETVYIILPILFSDFVMH